MGEFPHLPKRDQSQEGRLRGRGSGPGAIRGPGVGQPSPEILAARIWRCHPDAIAKMRCAGRVDRNSRRDDWPAGPGEARRHRRSDVVGAVNMSAASSSLASTSRLHRLKRASLSASRTDWNPSAISAGVAPSACTIQPVSSSPTGPSSSAHGVLDDRQRRGDHAVCPRWGQSGQAPITAVHAPAGARCFMANPQRGQLLQAPAGGRVLLVVQTLQRCSTQTTSRRQRLV